MSTQAINMTEVKDTNPALSEIKQATLLANLIVNQKYRSGINLENISHVENASADPDSIVTFHRTYSDDDSMLTGYYGEWAPFTKVPTVIEPFPATHIQCRQLQNIREPLEHVDWWPLERSLLELAKDRIPKAHADFIKLFAAMMSSNEIVISPNAGVAEYQVDYVSTDKASGFLIRFPLDDLDTVVVRASGLFDRYFSKDTALDIPAGGERVSRIQDILDGNWIDRHYQVIKENMVNRDVSMMHAFYQMHLLWLGRNLSAPIKEIRQLHPGKYAIRVFDNLYPTCKQLPPLVKTAPWAVGLVNSLGHRPCLVNPVKEDSDGKLSLCATTVILPHRFVDKEPLCHLGPISDNLYVYDYLPTEFKNLLSLADDELKLDDTNTTRNWYLADATYTETTSSDKLAYAFTFGRDVGSADGKYRWVRISM